MSLKSAKEFIDRMKNDPEFAKNVTACKDSETRRQLVASAGFDFTIEEMDLMSSGLSKEELTSVAGGSICLPLDFWGSEASG